MTKSFRKVWKGESLSKKQFLFIPFNLSKRHLALLFFNLKIKTLYILDPPKQHTDADLANKASIITNTILEEKFGYPKGFTIGSMSHFLQNDAVSCGVLSCYYASQIVKSTCSFLFKSAITCFIGLSFHDNIRKTLPMN